MEGNSMFDSLDERIRRDENLARTNMQRALQGAGILAVSIALFVALYLGILFLEY